MQLAIVPLIDVVFLLLAFFLLTASFRSREGFLPAELPRQAVRADAMEVEPLLVRLETLANGDCHVQIGSAATLTVTGSGDVGGFEMLAARLQQVLADQGRNRSDPVKLVPTRQTKWDHVVKAYDALWQLNLTNIIFTFVD